MGGNYLISGFDQLHCITVAYSYILTGLSDDFQSYEFPGSRYNKIIPLIKTHPARLQWYRKYRHFCQKRITPIAPQEMKILFNTQ